MARLKNETRIAKLNIESLCDKSFLYMYNVYIGFKVKKTGSGVKRTMGGISVCWCFIFIRIFHLALTLPRLQIESPPQIENDFPLGIPEEVSQSTLSLFYIIHFSLINQFNK